MQPRRITFQLTPLLDLLLIVIFAQYLEMQQTAATAQAELKHETAERVEAVRAERDAHRRQLQQSEERVRELEREQMQWAEQLRQREHELTAALERALEQQRQVGDLVSELFQLPDELVTQALEPRNPAEAARTPQEVERLKQSFRELARERGRDAIKHFLKFEEMRKRCDIWEIHITDTGLFRFRTGESVYEFRAETADEFADEVFSHYKTLPDLKRMVIVLFSYGEAKRVVRRAGQLGLPLAAARMQEDTAGGTRFEYADLGYSPDAPAAVER